MTAPKIKQLPISTNGGGKQDIRTQFAALCWRVKNRKIQVLLITSRGSKRWIIPKGWPMDERTPGQSALIEAWEEAGVIGTADERPLGLYSYEKMLNDDIGLPCVAMVYAVRVKSLARDWPERGQRRRSWMGRKKASRLVGEPELARILRDFDPDILS